MFTFLQRNEQASERMNEKNAKLMRKGNQTVNSVKRIDDHEHIVCAIQKLGFETSAQQFCTKYDDRMV